MKESIYNNKTISKIQTHNVIGDQGEGFQITLGEINQVRISKILCVWVCKVLGCSINIKNKKQNIPRLVDVFFFNINILDLGHFVRI